MSNKFLYKSIPLNEILLDSTRYNTNETGLIFEKLGFCNDVNQVLYKDLTQTIYSFISTNAYIVWQNTSNLNLYYSSYFSIFYSGIKSRDMCAYYEEYTIPSVYTITLTAQEKTCFSNIYVLLIGAGGSGGAGGGDRTGLQGTSGAAGGGGGFIGYKLDLKFTSGFSFTSFTITIGAGGESVFGNDGTANGGKDGLNGGDTILNVGTTISARANGGGGGGGGRASASALPGLGGTYFWDAAELYGTPLTVSGLSYSGYSNGYDSNDANTARRRLNGYYAAMDLLRSTTPTLYYYPQLQNVMTSQTNPYGKGGAGTPGRYDPNTTPTGPGGDGYARVYYML